MAAQGKTVFVTTHYMDEAENCNRLVMIYHGTMIAMGSPQEMKTNIMKNEIIEIIVEHSENWINRIAGLEAIKETALFGVNIHAVTYDTQKATSAIKDIFQQEGIANYTINKIMPSLEDVFVSLIENYDAEHKAK
jgi:ABC-2 type transport system ATP-binding protein